MKGIQLDKLDVKISIQTLSDGKIQGLVVGDILAQNQAILLEAYPGEIKENPIMGVGIQDMVLDHNPILWRTKIRETLEMDNQVVNDIKLTTSSVIIDAEYK